jgi:hypothetical protein
MKGEGMRRIPVAKALLFAVATTGLIVAKAQVQPVNHKKTAGYLDEDGTFHQLSPMPEATTYSTDTGKIVVTFEVKLESTIPHGAVVGCGLTIVEETSYTLTVPPFDIVGQSYTDTAASTVSAGATGSTVACTVTLPYSWQIPVAPSGATGGPSLGASYVVAVYNPSSTSIIGSSLEAYRSEGSTIPTLIKAFPKDGATTSATVDITL